MSKLDLLNSHIRNTKLDTKTLTAILDCFVEDLNASQTAQKTGLSRQTINSYYKLIREYLISQENMINNITIDKVYLQNNCITLKYLNFRDKAIYFIEVNKKIILIDEYNYLFSDINHFINNKLKKSLQNHKRANSARILFNNYEKEYFTASFLKSNNDVENFVNNRLKKFRGINKNNYMTHIKESIIRFNFDKVSLKINILNFFDNSNR